MKIMEKETSPPEGYMFPSEWSDPFPELEEEEILLNNQLDYGESNNLTISTSTEIVTQQTEADFDSSLFTNSSNANTNIELPIDMQFNSGHIVSISVYSVLFVLSAVGNVTLLAAIARRKRPQQSYSRIDFLLLHLAVADLIVTFFMMPLEIGWAATVYWTAGDGLCRVMSFFRIFGIYLSGFVLVCLAMDRFLAVSYPMHGMASTKRAKLMVTFAWCLSSACSFPQILIFHVESHPNFPWYTQCVTFNYFTSAEHELLYQLFGMVMMYALPFFLLAILYGSIAFHLCRMSTLNSNSRAVEVTSSSSRATNTNVFGYPDGLRRTSPGIRSIERAKVRSIMMTFVITAAFLVCWTPYYVMCVWYWADPESARKVDQRVQKGLFLFACTNSTVNPIVYGIFHVKTMFGHRGRSRFAHAQSPRATTVTFRSTSTTYNHV